MINAFITRVLEFDKPHRVIRDVLFLVIFVWQSASYGYFENMDRFPEGTHLWRKCDGASIAQNYAQYDLPFLKPEMHNMFEGSGQAVGEFPIWYFLVGKTYQVAGFSNSFFRWWWWGLLFIGFYFLFQWFYIKTTSTAFSLAFTVFCFTPPILVYYGVGFLPDTVALALSFVGLYLFEQWRRYGRNTHKTLAILVFTLAILTKVSAAILLLSLLSITLLTINRSNWVETVKSLIPWSFPFVATFFWVQYAAWYNSQTNNVYFLLGTVPYWSLTAEQIAGVQASFMELWYYELFAYKSHWLLTVPFFAAAILWSKKLIKETLPVVVFALITVLFVLLFYERFKNHDYYIISLYGMVPLCISFVVSAFLQTKPAAYVKLLTLAIVLPFIAQNVSATQRIVENRTNTWNYYNKTDRTLIDVDAWLTKNGVDKSTPVLSVFDPSPNVSLYFMNRKGLTNLYQHKVDSAYINKAKKMGIKYLLVHSEGFGLEKNKKLYCQDTLASYGNIHLFELN